MQQVVIIHGGNAFETYDKYLTSLREKDISLEGFRFKDWKSTLSQELGDGYDVVTPRMPNSNNARYSEWKIIFDKIVPLLDDNVILVGHSLGGIFLAKYLSENKYSKLIKAILLVAAPYNTPTRHPLVDFNITKPLDRLIEQGRKIVIYHSTDDEVVHFANAKQYLEKLPDVTLHEFSDRGHFNSESFPEIAEEIRRLSM